MTRAGGINLLLTLAAVGMVCACGVQALRASNMKAGLRQASREAVALNQALRKYYRQHGAYPGSEEAPGFNLGTLDPLRKRGYYKGVLTSTLLEGRLDAYHAPDDTGPNQEFWLEGTLRLDPSIRILVSHSDNAPMSGGEWMDGVFILRNGRLEPV